MEEDAEAEVVELAVAFPLDVADGDRVLVTGTTVTPVLVWPLDVVVKVEVTLLVVRDKETEEDEVEPELVEEVD